MKKLQAFADTLPEWLTYSQAGELSGGMSREILRYYIKRTQIAAVKRRKNFGSRSYYVLINKESLLAFLAQVQDEVGAIPVHAPEH